MFSVLELKLKYLIKNPLPAKPIGKKRNRLIRLKPIEKKTQSTKSTKADREKNAIGLVD